MDARDRWALNRGWDGRYSDAEVDRFFVAGEWRRFTPAELRALGIEPGLPGGPLDCIIYAAGRKGQLL